MKFLGFNLLSDAELRKRIEAEKMVQRIWDGLIIKKLLHSAETYRKRAEGIFTAVKSPHRN